MLPLSLKARWRRWVVRRIPAAAQVQLNQRRIFIMPNRVGAAFAAGAAADAAGRHQLREQPRLRSDLSAAAVFVVAILHTYRNLAGLILKAAGEAPPVFAGEQARVAACACRATAEPITAIAIGWPPQPLQTLDVPAQGQREMRADPAARCSAAGCGLTPAGGKPFPAGHPGGLELGRPGPVGAGLSAHRCRASCR